MADYQQVHNQSYMTDENNSFHNNFAQGYQNVQTQSFMTNPDNSFLDQTNVSYQQHPLAPTYNDSSNPIEPYYAQDPAQPISPTKSKKKVTLVTGTVKDTKKPKSVIKAPTDFLQVKKDATKAEQKKKGSKAENEIRKIKKISRWVDTLAALLAFSSSVIAYNENEHFYKIIYGNNEETIIKNQNQSDSVCTGLRALNMLFTVIICICIVIHYHYRLKILKLKKLKIQEDTIYTSGLWLQFGIEFLLCLVFVPPYVDYTFSGNVIDGTYTYSIDDIATVISLFKSYLILRLYAQYAPWTNEKADKICSKYKTAATVHFAIRAELKKRPYLMLGILMSVTIIYLGFAMRTFERSFQPDNPETTYPSFEYLANAFWLIIITMTTVGFGDFYPNTHLGRCVGVIACIIGMLLVSLMVVSLTVASEFTPEESKAFFILKRIYANDDAKEKAANVLKTIFKLRKSIKTGNINNTVEKFIWLTKLKKQIAVLSFLKISKNRIANSQNLPVDEMLKNLQEKLEADINEIKREVVAIPDLDSRCLALRDRQTKISNRLDEIIKLQSSIGEYLVKLNQLKK